MLCDVCMRLLRIPFKMQRHRFRPFLSAGKWDNIKILLFYKPDQHSAANPSLYSYRIDSAGSIREAFQAG